MTNRLSLTEVLDLCIVRVTSGESVEACLADYPEYAEEMREELEAAAFFSGAFSFQPDVDKKRAARLRMHTAIEKKASRRFSLHLGLPRGLFSTGTRVAAVVTAIALALAGTGTGTVLAARTSIPGDALYPVKRTTEQVQLALAFTDSQQAQVHEDIVNARTQELEKVTAAGREQFVPGLVSQIIDHSAKAEQLTSRPAERVAEGVKFQPSPTPTEAGTVTVTPTTDVPQGSETQVSLTPVLELTQKLEALKARVEALQAKLPDKSNAHSEVGRLRESLDAMQANLNGLLNRLDPVGGSDSSIDAGHPVDNGGPGPTPTPAIPVNQDNPTAPTAAPTPTPTETPVAQTVNGRKTAVVKALDVVVRGQRVVKANVKVRLDDGSTSVIVIEQGGTRLLKNGEQASIVDLRVGQQLELGVSGQTGNVLVVNIVGDGNVRGGGNPSDVGTNGPGNGRGSSNASHGRNQEGDGSSSALPGPHSTLAGGQAPSTTVPGQTQRSQAAGGQDRVPSGAAAD